MSGQFKLGEVVIVCGLTKDTHLNGLEVTITGGLAERLCLRKQKMVRCYLTDLPSEEFTGEFMMFQPEFLRKKRPPQSTDEWAAERVKQVTKPVAQPLEVA